MPRVKVGACTGERAGVDAALLKGLCFEAGVGRMAKVIVEKSHFSTHAEVMEDIRDTGFWPSTFVSQPSAELPLHYHDYDIIGYVMEGETYLLDHEGRRAPIARGDRLVIPKGAWHAEGAVEERVVYIVTVREAVSLMDAVVPRGATGAFPLS